MGEAHALVRVVARVLLQNDAGEVLLCRSRNGKAWVPPGGTVDPGENLTAAALREAVEEVGVPAELGRMLYLQEFRPSDRDELVIEVAFLARPLCGHPPAEMRAERYVEQSGSLERPWAAWYIQDADGPRREVRWFSEAQLAVVPEPVYPPYVQQQFWAADHAGDPYLGLVQAK